MTDNILQDLQRSFGLAGRRREARLLATAQDWRRLQEIDKTYAAARAEEIRRYHDEYDTRVEAARKRAIDDAGKKRRDLTHPWFGHDRFDKAETLRQAHRQVRADHRQALATIDRAETHAIENVLERARQSTRLRGRAKDDFSRSVDRRSGQDRRRSRER